MQLANVVDGEVVEVILVSPRLSTRSAQNVAEVLQLDDDGEWIQDPDHRAQVGGTYDLEVGFRSWLDEPTDAGEYEGDEA